MKRAVGWRARLSGCGETIAELLRLTELDQFRIIEEHDGVYLVFSDIPEQTNASQVNGMADAFVSALNDAVKLLTGANPSLVNGGVERVRPDGGRELFLFATAHFGIKVAGAAVVFSSDGTTVEPPSEYEGMPNLLSLVIKHKKLREVLGLWNREKQDWVNLYRIYEIIKCDTGNQFGKLGPSMRELDRFAHTANSPVAIGQEARHAVPRGKPPEDPMSLERAYDLIDHLIKGWVRSLQ